MGLFLMTGKLYTLHHTWPKSFVRRMVTSDLLAAKLIVEFPVTVTTLTVCIKVFLPRDAMRKRGLCCRPVSVRLSVRHVGAFYLHG